MPWEHRKECLGKATNAVSHRMALHFHVSDFRGEKYRKDFT